MKCNNNNNNNTNKHALFFLGTAFWLNLGCHVGRPVCVTDGCVNALGTYTCALYTNQQPSGQNGWNHKLLQSRSVVMMNGTKNKLDALPLCLPDRLPPCLLKKGHCIVQAWKANTFWLCFNTEEFAYHYRTKGRNPLTAHNCYPFKYTQTEFIVYCERTETNISCAVKGIY